MGMFDNLICKYKLPIDKKLTEEVFQTKDTPTQWLDLYEIREDGTLWHENYDTEDQSDPNAEGIKKFIGCMTKVNKRWEPVEDFLGEIRFYTGDDKYWIEFSAYFVDGKLNQVHLVKEKEKNGNRDQV